MTSNDKTNVGSGRTNYRTPNDLVLRLDKRYSFSYDAAASRDNAIFPVTFYSTIEGTFYRPTPGTHVNEDARDGLAYPWEYLRVFLNPPYASPEQPCPEDRERCAKKRCEKRGHHVDAYQAGISDFVAKAHAERDSAAIIVGVIPTAPDTAWWREHVHDVAEAHHIGRVPFIDPDTGNEATSPPGGTSIVVWRPSWLPRGS